ncbi:MAG: acetate kinase [Candidatus Riflebacteria bacterium]|nr:acetate kinase [Candidatus Riflebacteria bacterium]
MVGSEDNGKIILVLNCGSSSLKYDLIKMPHRQSLGKGLVERIGEEKSVLEQKSGERKLVIEQKVKDHHEAMELVMKAITDKDEGIINNVSEIAGIGHRVVHGGDKYASSVIIDESVVAAIEEFIELAPLHNPPNLIGVQVARSLMPDLPQVAVFDTAFHQTMPPHAYLYGLPRKFYEEFKIRRYGFHGTSHRYVAARVTDLCKRHPSNTNVISCHLGNGGSVTAIAKGRSIDTSMGFTPLEGMIMGTRCGDLDPAIIGFLMERGYSSKELMKVLNKESGLLGLSGVSNDMRDLEKAADEGNHRAKEAIDCYAYRVRKYIGAYSANLIKVDALVFTGGIGQNGWRMRERICRRLENIGIFMDFKLNKEMGSKEGIVSEAFSPVTVAVIPTNEELQIAIDVYELAFSGKNEYRRRETDFVVGIKRP